MKRGTEYAKRVKRLFQQLTKQFGKPAAGESTDPLEEVIVAILSACTTRSKARAVFRKLRQQTVDLNELRVTPPVELAEMIGNGVPLARVKAERIVNTLNDIRRRQDKLDLSFLRQRGRREAREYLESLAGVDRAAAADVVLYSLGGHAVPVDDLTLYILRKDGLVDASADGAEVQGFLERHISAAQSRLFVELLGRHVAHRGSRVPVDKLDQLLNPPPPEPSPQKKEASAASTAEARGSRASARAGSGSRKQRPAPAAGVKRSVRTKGSTARSKKKTGRSSAGKTRRATGPR